MCLIVLAVEPSPDFRLVLASNRDEFHERPTDPMHWWPDHPVLAGRDKRSGGTWLAVRRDASLALVTNYRSGAGESGKRSRGEIPLAILDQGIAPGSLTGAFSQRRQYSGYNLIAGDGNAWFYSGSEDRVPYRRLHRGLYGLSNQLLQSDWPKVIRGRRFLQSALADTGSADEGDTQGLHHRLIKAFRDETPAADERLPDTGVGIALERTLSPLFIRGSAYGTRATTIVTLDHRGWMHITEQQYGPEGHAGDQQKFAWQVRT